MPNARDDVLIIGGGHNGLVCAAYLAAAGLKVRVLERRGIVGGAAATVEFQPRFRNTRAS
jgi:phytoene dehydrogenase-like protein